MTIDKRYQAIQESLLAAAKACNRPIETIKLIAATKGQSVTVIKHAYALGITNFGENYYQEGLAKITALQHLPITWHFLGAIQSNKTACIAQNFSWVHSLCRKNIAVILNKTAELRCQPIKVCLQVNLDNEPQKQGLLASTLFDFIEWMQPLSFLELRGLMTIANLPTNFEAQYQSFLRLKRLLFEANRRYDLTMDTLSMGMSADYKAAVYAGATFVRIGQGLFGQRN